ncbi:polysaccharide deacetylase family protein [Streptomyces liangshanensis]|uniref:polysaccharide deacetylase family protein n=1 Tax=Streptomyces liangshanensis TaxID=2717324 RepID=UPI001FBA73E6|nr:polysaccharide deacetylase family protein [Streptomyces liangshanensis]
MLVLIAAVLVTGCGGQRADGSKGADGSDGKGGGVRVDAPRTPSATPSTPATPAAPTPPPTPPTPPGQTSSPDPKLPPPLVSMDIAHAVEGGGRSVNITIDDGPDPTWTPKILKILRDNGARATFCMIGPQAEAHPDLVKRVVADGHRLCDHTVTHNTSMDHRSKAYQKDQILVAAGQITRASGGVKPLYYRAPGGAFTPYSRQIAASAGMRPLGWNVDSKDYEEPGVHAITHLVKHELGNGPTILFHDGGGDRGQTAAALRKLLPWLRHHGYGFGFPVR